MQAITKQTIKIYSEHVSRYRWSAFLLVSGIIGANIINTVIPLYYKKFFDTIASSSPLTVGIAPLLISIILTVFLLSSIEWGLYRLVSILSIRLQSHVIADLSQTAFAYLIQHSYNFFTNSFSGSLVRKVNRLSRSFEEIADQVTWSLLPLMISIIGILIVVFKRNVTIGFILLGWVFIFLLINYLFSNWKQKYELAKAAKDSEATGVLADAITNSVNIKLFTGYTHELTLYHKVMEEWRRITRFSWRLNEVMDAIQAALMIAIEFAIFYFAVKFWQRSLLTIGDFALLQAYLVTLLSRLWDFGRVLRRLYSAFADAAEMIEIMKTPHEIRDKAAAKSLVVTQGKIEFKQVDFSFHQTRKVLDKFNLTIAPGERVALVGSSGAGKSTITNVLFRFYDIDRGQILIDGQNIAEVTQASLRDAIALVPQEPILFHRTLMENIRYGRRDATDEEVMAASRRARCHEFINELPEAYNTYVGERGIKLSGGERQRVAIARAILKNAPILALDEATSSLDSESEALIQDALRELMHNKTVIVIAHRLSTIMQMDRIVVIDEGQVVDTGTHQELLKRAGIYQTLWEIQAGGFLP